MALRVKQQVARLQVSVQQVYRVHVFQALEYLVDDILLVDVFENVGTDHCVQVSIHEVEDEVDVTIVLSSDYVLKTDYVLVAGQLLQEDNLSESTLRISCVLESIKILLDSHNLLCSLVNCLPDNAVRSLAYEKISKP